MTCRFSGETGRTSLLGQLVALPALDGPRGGFGQTEAEKEAEALIAPDGTRRGHAGV